MLTQRMAAMTLATLGLTLGAMAAEPLWQCNFDDGKTAGWNVRSRNTGEKDYVRHEPATRPGDKGRGPALCSGMLPHKEVLAYGPVAGGIVTTDDLALRLRYHVRTEGGDIDRLRVHVWLAKGRRWHEAIAPVAGRWHTLTYRLADMFAVLDCSAGQAVKSLQIEAWGNFDSSAVELCLDDLMLCRGAEAEPETSEPLSNVSHPRLFYTPNEIADIREKVKRYDWAAVLLREATNVADGWLKKKILVPERKGGYPVRLIACFKCGKPSRCMLYDYGKPNQLTCAHCGAVRSDDLGAFPADAAWTTKYSCAASAWRSKTHIDLGRGVKALGLAYAVAGNEQHARAARQILVGYAHRYADYVLDVGAKVFPYRQEEQHWLVDLAAGYDLVLSSPCLSGADRLAIENRVLRASARTLAYRWGGSKNLILWNRNAIAAVGFCLGDQALIDFALNGSMGFRWIMANWLDDDGSWVEAHPGYFCYALQATEVMCEMACRSGVDFYKLDKIRRFFAYPVVNSYPDATWQTRKLPIAQIETAYRRYHAPVFAWAIREYYRKPSARRRASLLSEPEVAPPDGFRLASVNFPKRGNALLRAGQDDSAICVHFDYEPRMAKQRGWKLKTMPFALGRLLHPKTSIFYDRLWNNATLAYNTVVVDEQAQALSDGELRFFGAAPQVSIIEADANAAYPHTKLRRTLLLTDRYLLDLFRVVSDQPRRMDWLYHNRGELDCAVKLEPRKGPLGIADGYLEVTEVCKGWADDTWEAVWRMQDRDDPTRVTLRTGLDGEQVGSTGGKRRSPAGEAIWRTSIPESIVITDRRTHLGSKAAIAWVTEAMGKDGGEWWLDARHSDAKALVTVLFVQAPTRPNAFVTFSYFVDANPAAKPSLVADVYDDKTHFNFEVQPLKLGRWCNATIPLEELCRGKYSGFLRSITFILRREVVSAPFNVYLDDVAVHQGEDREPPCAIDDLTATRDGDDVRLRWSIPRDALSGVAHFDVFAGRGDRFVRKQATKLNAQPLTHAHELTHAAGAEEAWAYWVEAADHWGNRSLSNRAAVGVLPMPNRHRGSGMRLTMLGEKRTRVITGKGASGEASALVCVRRRAKGTVFAALLEPYVNRAAVQRVTRLPLKLDGKPCTQTEALGVKVECPERTEHVIVAYAPGLKGCDAMACDGTVGVVSCTSDGVLRYAYLGQGRRLRLKEAVIESATETSLYVERMAGGRWLVHNQGSADTTLAVGSPFAAKPVVYALDSDQQRTGQVQARCAAGRVEWAARAGAMYEIADKYSPMQ